MLSFANGAQFVRAALQVNPFSYLLKKGQNVGDLTEERHNEGIVAGCIEVGIAMIAVTDHYSIGDSMSLIEMAEDRGVFAFPGFEAATSDGVHYLCVFERGTPVREIERCIGACGPKRPEDEDSVGDIPSTKLLALAEGWGAVVVAAHVTDSKGILNHLSGKSRVRSWTDDRLIAAALASPRSSLQPTLANILDCKASSYKREFPPAVIYAKDILTPKDLRKPAAWTWLRVSEASVNGLRHAFLDPESRVRFPEDPQQNLYPRLVSIGWAGGFLDGVRLELNPALNVLVGPRGAGKSTVLESIRFVLELDPLGKEAEGAHNGFVEKVLRPGTKVAVVVEDPERDKSWVIERGVHAPAVVSTIDGVETNLSPEDILGRVEFFGQHEVAELARLPQERSQLLGRFQPTAPKTKRSRADVEQDLVANRDDLIAGLEGLATLSTRLESLPGIRDRLETFANARVRQKLELEARYQEEEPLFAEVEDALDSYAGQLSELESLEADFLNPDQIDDLPSTAELRALRSVLLEVSDRWSTAKEALQANLDEAREKLAEARRRREEKKKSEHDAYLERLRELQAENIDGEQYLELERRKAELEGDLRKQTAAQVRIEKLRGRRDTLLREWARLQKREYKGLEMAAKRVSQALRSTVRVVCRYQGDRRALIEFLRECIAGQLHNVVDAIEQRSELDPIELAATCREGEPALQAFLQVEGKQVAKLCDLEEKVLLEMEELWLPATTSIELRVGEQPGGEPVWRGLEDLSTGEKATAILLLLLLSSDRSAPLVIDQAEDDLDNSFIADDIVPRLRAEKNRRQFILSTHNPNIPVLGDAEQVARLTPEGEATSGGRGAIKQGHTGSLDRESIREVIEALEGGRTAFERRRRRYGY